MILIDGRKLSREIFSEVKNRIASLDFQPVFCDVLVGNDPVSLQYVQMKAKMAEKAGLRFHNAFFPASITTDDLIKEIEILNKIKNICGIIVQLPLPKSVDRRRILDSIDPSLDVDCLGTVASEKFYRGVTVLGFPTALACLTLLDSLDLDLAGKKIVVLGWGELVGKPVAALLRHRGLSPIVITDKTENKKELIKQADIIISGIGQGKYITGDMIKKGTILIDAGTSEEVSGPPSGGGQVNIVGDVDLESVKDVASFVSPVPGGVGPVTVAMLLKNVFAVAENKNE